MNNESLPEYPPSANGLSSLADPDWCPALYTPDQKYCCLSFRIQRGSTLPTTSTPPRPTCTETSSFRTLSLLFSSPHPFFLCTNKKCTVICSLRRFQWRFPLTNTNPVHVCPSAHRHSPNSPGSPERRRPKASSRCPRRRQAPPALPHSRKSPAQHEAWTMHSKHKARAAHGCGATVPRSSATTC